MARMNEEEIERIKAEISVQRLAESAGVELKRHGKDLLGRCPFHDDRTPSLVITPSKNLWHCLGACQTGGGPIDWVMKKEGVKFPEAVRMLLDEHPSLVAPSAGAVDKPRRSSKTPKRTGVLESGMSDAVLLDRVMRFYERQLAESPAALKYLETRGLKHPELLKTFRLGFCDRELCKRIPEKNRKEGAAIRTQLQELGVMRKTGHELFRGSIVVPVFDAEGCVVEMYGRDVGPDPG